MTTYSQSRLTSYENCPQQYKLRYIDKIRPPEAEEGIEMFLGSRVHETLEKLHKDLVLTKLNTLEELLAYFETQWEKNWHEHVVITKKGFAKSHYHDSGVQAITQYYARYYPFRQSITLATEYRVNFKVNGFSIQGVIDRLTHDGKGLYEIHDYKTSRSLPSQDKTDSDRQLALYQIGLKERYPDAKKVNLIWHYLLFDKEQVATWTDAQLEDLKSQVTSLIKTIERETKFEPTESALCDWCEFPEYCPAKKHGLKVENLPLNKYLKEKGVVLVNQYATISAQIKEQRAKQVKLEEELELIEEAAIEYAKKEGVTSITGSDHLLRLSERDDFQFPGSKEEGREELEAYVRKAGIWEDVSMLSLPRLVKLVQEEGVETKIAKAIMKFADQVTKTSVRLVKKKEDEE
jgi:putative RecB family exonuclease